jgi:pheganomycin biosynthesis PGM1-like protein
MSLGPCRWLSCSRGIWESLALGAESDLAIVTILAPRLGTGVNDYLSGLLPPGDHRYRHALVEIDDARDCHLSEKLLKNPEIIERLRSTVNLARQRGHQIEGLSCYSSSVRMAELADCLAVELIDAAPELLRWGTKSGSRQVFRTTGIMHPAGSYQVDVTLDGLASTLNDLTLKHGHGSWIVKADDGFGSGHGNAVIDTARLPSPLSASTVAVALEPCAAQISAVEFGRRIVGTGVVVEQLVIAGPGDSLRYPSALGYLRRVPGGGVKATLLAVHDQVLGQAGDFNGCRFPAHPGYRLQAATTAAVVLDHLAALGVTGHVGVDFIAVMGSDGRGASALYAAEINVRQTGTTHPHQAVRALVPGTWTAGGTMINAFGHDVCYAATDSIISPRYRGVSVAELIDALCQSSGIAFDPDKGIGVIPHLWSSLETCGKIGATFVAPSAAACETLERGFRAILEDLAIKQSGRG